MGDIKKSNPITNYGYQPNVEQHKSSHGKKIRDGYQPAKSVSTQPPNKGSNVQQLPKDK